MAYLIYDITKVYPDSYKYYFLDANVWIAYLKYTGKKPLDAHEQAYIDFFEAVITLHSHPPSLQKKLKNIPKFIVTSLLLSEIINAYMRNVAMKVYYSSQSKDYKDYEFKKDYRVTGDYTTQLKLLVNDFVAFKDYIELRDDNFIEIDPYSILPDIGNQTDFNDYYYFYSFVKEQIPIITNDSDFVFIDLPIITSQRKLLQIVAVTRTGGSSK